MKTFKAKSSVSRWAKKELGDAWQDFGTVEQDEEGLYYFLVNYSPVIEVEEIEGETQADFEINDDPEILAMVEKELAHDDDDSDAFIMSIGSYYQPIIGRVFDDGIVVKTKPCLKGKSAISGPCRVVWDLAEVMAGARRKDIIQACVDAGIAYYTARTQYQKYTEALKGSN